MTTATPQAPGSKLGPVSGYMDLVDYRGRVAEHYAEVRLHHDPEQAWHGWRRRRDSLFASHSQSPLEPEARTAGYEAPFVPYDPAYRVVAHPQPRRGSDVLVVHSDGATTQFEEVATLEVQLPTGDADLALYWLPGYGGGLFLPFRDATSGAETFGGGRYLLDTVKGADLGSVDGGLILDFNFAYNPSCSYNDIWSCPLAPRRNHLSIPVHAGELHQNRD